MSDMVGWSTVLGWAKILTPRLMLAICIVSAVLLFSPAAFIARIGLTSFRATSLQWVGLAFLASAGLLVAYGALEHLPQAIKNVRFRIRRKRRAGSLTTNEKRVMQSYIRSGTRTQRFNIDSGTLSGLMAYGIVQLASRGPCDPAAGFPFNITDWAYQHFKTHPELIDTPGVAPWNPMDGLP
jgi:hypothetical protein